MRKQIARAGSMPRGSQNWSFPAVFLLLVVCIASLTGEITPAAEESERFLQALRERGYLDLALDYIEQMRTSPLCPESFREVLDYEAGVLLIENSRLGGTLREKSLEQAKERLQQFIREKPTHSRVSEASFLLANVAVELAQLKKELAAQPGKTPEEKNKLLAEARQRFQEAQKAFETAERRAYERARTLEEEAKQNPRKEVERDDARRDLLRARLSLAGVIYEIGKLYPQSDPNYRAELNEAAKRFAELYEKYKDFTAGVYARLQEGRVRRDLGDPKAAIEIFKQVIALLQGVSGEERSVVNEAVHELIQSYILTKDFNSATALIDQWRDQVRPDEESSGEGLRVHLSAAQLFMAVAASQKPKTQEHTRAVARAREHLNFVTRFPGPLQREAGQLLSQQLFGGASDPSEPTDFATAKERGDTAWGSFVVFVGQLNAAPTPQERQKLQQQADQVRDEALRFYRLALAMRPNDLSPDEMNLLRFRMAYLYWSQQDYYRAAVLGEFLARNYPQNLLAKQAAEIAVKAYRILYAQSSAPREERDFETSRIEKLVTWMNSVWPKERETIEAYMMLLDTAVDNRDLAKAEAILGQIPEDSPRRAEAELRVGQGLWATFLLESSKESEVRPSAEQLAAYLQKARQLLEQGIGRMKSSFDESKPVEYTLAFSVLSLAGLLIENGQASDAVTWLEDPQIGSLVLVRKNDPAADRSNFRVETLKAALRAYVGTGQLEKAEGVMKELEVATSAGGDAAAAARLTQVYVGLARQLQESLRRLRQDNKLEEADRLMRGFELFLTQIKSRKEGNTFTSLNWVGETFYNLACSLEGGSPGEKAKSQEYYKNAADTYVGILRRIRESPDFAPANAATGIQLRLASCLSGLRKFEEAVKILLALLRQKETRIDVQVEAARTYQAWADAEGRAAFYTLAIVGGHEEKGRKLMWGWQGVARRVQPYPQYQSLFHEAWYNIALCRLNQAQRETEPKRSELLRQAELDIFRVYQLYPDLGGEATYARYDALLRRIQRLRGVRDAQGLQAFAQRGAPVGKSL